jgi:glycosyltransferase involved in cell wall biosynthesis
VPVDGRPSVGAAIPACNAERWLPDAIESLLAQTAPPEDILVLDDGSNDRTAALAAGFGGRVRVVSQPNSGIGAARNRAVELVRGEIVAFLDADDLYTPSSIATRLAVLLERPHVDVVFGHERRFAEIRDGEPVPIGPSRPSPLPGSMLVRRGALELVGQFPADTRVAEGLDWLLRAQELSIEGATVEEQVLWRRVHGENNSVRHRDSMGEFARTLKASLDRRRVRASAGAEANVSVESRRGEVEE